jgi:hypothetical protein
MDDHAQLCNMQGLQKISSASLRLDTVSVQHNTNIPLLQLRNIDDHLGGYLSKIAPIDQKNGRAACLQCTTQPAKRSAEPDQTVAREVSLQHLAPVKEP